MQTAGLLLEANSSPRNKARQTSVGGRAPMCCTHTAPSAALNSPHRIRSSAVFATPLKGQAVKMMLRLRERLTGDIWKRSVPRKMHHRRLKTLCCGDLLQGGTCCVDHSRDRIAANSHTGCLSREPCTPNAALNTSKLKI